MNPSDLEKNADLLRKANLRQTQPRLAVLEELTAADTPITPHQIADRISGHAPDKVTIYRVLECFMEKGIVHKAYTKNRTAFYELGHNCSETQCHPHFTCISCGRTFCIRNAKIPLAEINEKGFIIKHQKVELEGICPECNKKNAKPEK